MNSPYESLSSKNKDVDWSPASREYCRPRVDRSKIKTSLRQDRAISDNIWLDLKISCPASSPTEPRQIVLVHLSVAS